MSRRLSDACLSDLELDQLVLDALDAPRGERARGHLGACGACRAREDELRRDRERFQEQPLRLRGLRPASRGAPRSLIVAVVALAAGLALWVTRTPKTPGGDASGSSPSAHDTVGVKGSPYELVGVIERDGHQLRAASGDVVRPRDRIQLAYSTSEAIDLYVIGVDGRGKAQGYFPELDSPARVEPGREVELPFSIVLDETAGKERFYAYFCRDLSDRRALDGASEAAARSGQAPVVPGCEASTLELEKQR